MEGAVTVFVTGIAGVFAGMTLLYLTVRLNAFVAGKIDARMASKSDSAAESTAAPEDARP